MSILSDEEIRSYVDEKNMISPFVSKKVRKGVISYGISSYGYDARLDGKFKILPKVDIVDIKKPSERYEEITEKEFFILDPKESVLSCTVEYFKIPRDILVLCVGKSTYARSGLIVNVTPLEPCWEGIVTLELFNSSNSPLKLYVNEGICQFLFFKNAVTCKTSYACSGGTYMYQEGVTNSMIGGDK